MPSDFGNSSRRRRKQPLRIQNPADLPKVTARPQAGRIANPRRLPRLTKAPQRKGEFVGPINIAENRRANQRVRAKSREYYKQVQDPKQRQRMVRDARRVGGQEARGTLQVAGERRRAQTAQRAFEEFVRASKGSERRAGALLQSMTPEERALVAKGQRVLKGRVRNDRQRALQYERKTLLLGMLGNAQKGANARLKSVDPGFGERLLQVASGGKGSGRR